MNLNSLNSLNSPSDLLEKAKAAANRAKQSTPRLASAPAIPASDYTPADLQEMDGLLRELVELEGWTPDELRRLLDERRRMAPASVPAALQALKNARNRSLAPWPDRPSERSRIHLCRLTGIEGGKTITVKTEGGTTLTVIEGGKT